MFIRVLDCIRAEHDLRLVLLAILVSLISGYALFVVLGHARMQQGRARYGWATMAACVAGGGIWATHFVAMLGFSPAVATGYDTTLTFASALLSILIAGMAMPLLLSAVAANAVTGALVLNFAIASMHFTGMRALVFAGSLEWDPVLVALSIGSGALLVSVAIVIERRSASARHRVAATALFGAAICSLHFTAMAAALLRTDPSRIVADGDLSEVLLGLSVVLVMSLIVMLSLVTVVLDKRAVRAAADAARIRSMIEAARTGIVLCQSQMVVAANQAFGSLVGMRQDEIEGRPLACFVAGPIPDTGDRIGHPVEAERRLITGGGVRIDVAFSTTPIPSSGPPLHLIEVRDIRAEKTARERMAHLANHDALTGLPNLRLFRAELQKSVEEAAMRRGELGLLWLDLDHFKEVNDTHGHAAGDALLCSVAERLQSALGGQHLLARIGGDEFAVLCEAGQRSGDPAAIATRLLTVMAQPVQVDDHQLQVGLSIGLAMYPQDAHCVTALMRKADNALYETKRTGRGRWSRAA
jgi:diguanylate cyclase (GGDEF)-like protein/PAS domain S-box-containing protein